MTGPRHVQTVAGDWIPEPPLWNTDKRNPSVQARTQRAKDMTDALMKSDPQYRAEVLRLRNLISR